MQASKISAVICLGAVSVMTLVARAEDTPEQARLRELLHQAMAGNPTPAPAPAPAAPVAAPAAPVVTAPAEPAAPAAPAVAAPAEPAAPAAPEAAAPTAPAVEAAPVDTPIVAPIPPAGDSPEQARLRDVLHETIANTPAPVEDTNAPAMETPAAPAESAPVVTDASAPAAPTSEMSSMETNAPAMESGMTNAEASAMKQAEKPAPVPQRDLTPDQRQRLDALTAQYKADQISPAQYHEQRAKIIAEP